MVIEGARDRPAPGPELDRLASLLLAHGLRARDVRDLVAEFFSASRSEVYERVLALRDAED